MTDLRVAFEFLTDTNTVVQALQEAENYRRKLGSFATDVATRMALDLKTSLGTSFAIFHLNVVNGRT